MKNMKKTLDRGTQIESEENLDWGNNGISKETLDKEQWGKQGNPG